jgi:spermidine synthase/S-adenosylmethionine decarboxylase
MNGLHLIADLHDCRCAPALLLDAAALETYCSEACLRHGLTVVGRLFHAFRDPAGAAAGVTGAVVLAESHLAVHTWPECAGVTIDLYVCNYSGDNSARARALFAELLGHFAAARVARRSVARGTPRPVQAA